MIESSYAQNDYGAIFFRYVETYRPHRLVECGVLNGYSTLHIARALKHIHENYSHHAKLDAYDLWDNYEYKHGNKEEVQKLLDDNQVSDYVNLLDGDAFEVHKNYHKESLCFLHVDVSNDGGVLKKVMEVWSPKITYRGIIMFEGGSIERDNIEWMKKYNKASIREELESNATITKYYWYGIYEKFPSLTVLLRKTT